MCSHGRFVPGLITILFLFLAGTAGTTEVNPEKWKKSLSVDITTTQTSYSDSWVGGEAGSVNWVSNLNALSEKQIKHWFEIKTTLKLSFGQTLTQDADDKSWGKPKKSTDLIDCENVGRFTTGKFVDPYTAFRVESQFMDASDTLKKLYFNPVKLTESAGITRKFFENDGSFITSRFGLGLRQIFKRAVNDQLATVDSTLVDGGIESVTDIDIHVNDKLRYTGKLTLYKALYFSRMDDVKGTPYEDDWKAIDINWENIVSASITKIVAVNLYTQLLYDKEVSSKGRFKQTLAIGFVFKMI
ncbi:MAG: DUF3078 domain-containing protein [candidate division Zixibacteria bacterium]|nr:DUF3078 domain-containing protein [candidate division Zixibacteria bacterium]